MTEERVQRAVKAAIDRWEAKNGWRADFAVVQGFQIVVDEQYAEMLAENEELRRLLDLLVPYGWEHSEERPGLRRTYEACERILQRNDGCRCLPNCPVHAPTCPEHNDGSGDAT